ncbi:DNA replication protein DnaC [Ureibacillus xyleni]|uniref:DNA replication protein DnaC n=1 Tax=Ureibacillus xyleni TaxID=614648 RepID=A0A285SJN4_9BACL|nr:ATP-binding protein [Ureibacillus xyleni]SOC06353.1 DNA replication protein DnaC [Ureibacillus xyleni]
MRKLSEIKLPHNLQMALTSKFCDLHRCHYMLINNKEMCTVCETDKLTQQLERELANEILQQQTLAKYNLLYKQSILQDETLLEAGFKNYYVTEHEEVANKERAIIALNQFRKGEVFNIWLTGNTGVGKSHLAMALLRSLNEFHRDVTCLFVDVDEMLRRIRDSFHNRESKYTEQYVTDLLASVDYLVLDDLGAETGDIDTEKRASDYTSRVLRGIINARQKKSTIITTNLNRAKLEAMYDRKLVSRLMKNTYLIHFAETKDKRIRNIEF